MSRLALALTCALGCLAALAHRADAADRERDALLLFRVLAYNHVFVRAEAASRPLSLVILSAPGDPDPDCAAWSGTITRLGQTFSLGNRRIRVHTLTFLDASDLAERLRAVSADALFACAGLDAEVPAIAAVTRKSSVLSVSSEEAYARRGLAISLVRRGDRQGIVVNLPAAGLESARLDVGLLGVAEVLR